MSKSNTINKKKGIILIADDMFSGMPRKEILSKYIKTYQLNSNTIDSWIKAARPLLIERRKEEEEMKRLVMKETIEDTVKRLGLGLEEVLTEYKKVAFFDIRKIFDENGSLKSLNKIDDESAGAIGGVESFEERSKSNGKLGTVQKIKIASKVSALDSICKALGYVSPVKIANTDKDGNDVKQVMIINGKQIEF